MQFAICEMKNYIINGVTDGGASKSNSMLIKILCPYAGDNI
jgi:hypothetical protein